MCSLSSCLFEWDQTDFDNLVSAKRAELVRAGVSEPTPSSICTAISKEELANHCKRHTRGCSETTKQVEALLLAMSPATDSLGARLFNEEMQAIWDEQRRLQDEQRRLLDVCRILRMCCCTLSPVVSPREE